MWVNWFDKIKSSLYSLYTFLQNLFLTDLNTHTSRIDQFYSREFSVSVKAVRIRSYVPPPVHDETDVFDYEVDNRVWS